MEELFQQLTWFYSPEGIEHLIRSGGIWVLILIVFAETGLLAGFFFPGDSLLVTAGVFCSSSINGNGPVLNIVTLNLSLMAAAVVGDQVGFILGRKTGPKIFNRPDSRIFKKKYVIEAHQFYEKHGGKAIFLARFMPILRTFVPFIAGVAEMNYRHFVIYNVVGGISWVFSMTMLGYFLGRSPWGEKLHMIILVVIFISILPLIVGILKRFIFARRRASSI